MTSLYALTDQFLQTAEMLADLDLPDEVVADTLESLQFPIEQKATNVAMFVRNLEATAEAIKEAEAEMAKRRKSIENRIDRVRTYLMDNMILSGIQKIECPYFKLSIRDNPPAVKIDDAGKIPSDLYVYPEAPAPYPDKKAIAAKLKAGEVIDGAHLEQGKRLEIK